MRNIIFIILFISCKEKTNIKVVNKTNSIISDITILSQYGKKKKSNLNVNEIYLFKFDITDAISKEDGVFIISYKLNKKKITHQFGYYTNGEIPKKNTNIIIMEDEIILDKSSK